MPNGKPIPSSSGNYRLLPPPPVKGVSCDPDLHQNTHLLSYKDWFRNGHVVNQARELPSTSAQSSFPYLASICTYIKYLKKSVSIFVNMWRSLLRIKPVCIKEVLKENQEEKCGEKGTERQCPDDTALTPRFHCTWSQNTLLRPPTYERGGKSPLWA